MEIEDSFGDMGSTRDSHHIATSGEDGGRAGETEIRKMNMCDNVQLSHDSSEMGT